MKTRNTFFAIIVLSFVWVVKTNAQTVLTGGFGTGGMGIVNGTAYAKTGTLGSGGFPFVSAAKDGSAFYAASPSTNKFYFINAAGTGFTDSLTIYLNRISSSNEPDVLFGNTATSLVRINTTAKSVTDSLVLGALWEITERPNAKEVWVTDSGKLHIVDYTSALTPTTITVASSPYDYSKVAFSPGGSMAFKAASNSKKLYKINPVTKTLLDSVNTAPYGFSNMVVSHDSSKLFICNSNMVMIYNPITLTVMDSIDCGTRPAFNIYRHPSRNEIWVVHHFNDSVSVFNENTKALIAAFNISGSPWYIAFGGNSTSSVSAVSLQRAINLFPNPAKKNITLTGLNTDDKISVLDITGRLVQSWKASDKTQTFDISSFAGGSYILYVTDKNGNVANSSLFEKK